MISAEELARRDQVKNMLVEEAAAFYRFDTLHVFERAQRRERLLATAIYYKLNTEEAALLADATEERERG